MDSSFHLESAQPAVWTGRDCLAVIVLEKDFQFLLLRANMPNGVI